MNSNSMTYQAYVQILKEELLPAMGCTEPIAIAYCAAKARDVLGEIPDSIEVEASGNIIKNVKSVVVPNTEGRKGLEAAAAIGVLGGDALKDGKGREGRELRRGVAVVGRDGDAFFKNALLHSCLRCAFSSARGGSADAAPRGGGDAARSPQRRPS